jgi:hypothetical protein
MKTEMFHIDTQSDTVSDEGFKWFIKLSIFGVVPCLEWVVGNLKLDIGFPSI